jgi:integrase/recombinase XerC
MNNFPDFKSYLQDRGLSVNTVSSYIHDMIRFGNWFSQTNGIALEPGKLTPTDVREYKQFLLITVKRSPSTINRHLAAIKAYIQFALDQKLIEADPTRHIKGIEELATSPRWLSKQDRFKLERELEQQALAARSDYSRFKSAREIAIYYLLVNTGIRLAELCALELDDLKLSDRKGSIVVRQAKGGKFKGVPLNNQARLAMVLWIEQRPKNNNSLFQIKPRAVENFVADLGERVGVEVTPHMLRHTFAKSLINAKVSIEKVATLLGHERLDTTRRYITPSREDLEKAVGELD